MTDGETAPTLRAANGGRLPVNVKFVVEREEEIGSAHLPAWIEASANVLDADVCIWEFGGIDDQGHPLIICGLRALARLPPSRWSARAAKPPSW